MTILSIVRKACPAIGISPPTTVMGSTSPQVATLLALAEIGGGELAEAHPWQRLTRRVLFPGVPQNSQTGQPPEGYNRLAPVQRIWDVTRKTWLIGPLSANDWDAIAVREDVSSPGYWCIIDDVLQITPAPTVDDSFRYTYVSENWIRPNGAAADGTGDVDEYGADNDVPLLNEKLLKLDLIWRWKQTKGLDYAEDMSTFERKKEKIIARDTGPREITTTNPFPEGPPEGYWPGTITGF